MTASKGLLRTGAHAAVWLALGMGTAARATEPARLLNLSIAELGEIRIDTVYGASKSTEKVTEAPSSVTIVTRDEISRFGYRTLSDIVRATRSFDVTYDRNYSYTGVRGFNSLGDFGARILLLVDGHRMNDPIYDNSAMGTDGLLDVDLIERVEFIRGPGSAIYGSNAFFGVINVITRSGASVNGVEASDSGGSFETYSGRFTLGKKLSNGIEYLLSGTTYASEGPAHLFFPEYNSPQTHRGIASHQDGDRFWSSFGKVSYGEFTLEGGYVSRDKDVPTGSYGSVFNLPNTTVDSRGYVELRYAHLTSSGWALSGRASYDIYDYFEHFTIERSNVGNVLNDDSAREHWWDAEVTASRTFLDRFRFDLGTELRQSSDLHLRNEDLSPWVNYFDERTQQRVLGAYVDGRWEISKALSLSSGIRWDHYDSFGNTFNPRAALIVTPREGTIFKLLYGRAFRAPNIYQIDYSAHDQSANPDLQPEIIHTYEAVAEQYFGKHWRGTVSLFHNEISSLIEAHEDAQGDAIFTNSGDARVNGIESELECKWENGMLVRASYTRQSAINRETGLEEINSPEAMCKAHVSVPVFGPKVFASLELLYASDRLTLTRQSTGEAWLLNATLFSRELKPGLEVSASVYNLLDQKFRVPGGEEHRQDTLVQDGRTLRVKVTYRF